jgi:hypothetical protein
MMMKGVCDRRPAVIIGGEMVPPLLTLPSDARLADDGEGVPLVRGNARVHLGEEVLQVLHRGALRGSITYRSVTCRSVTCHSG